MPSTVIRSLHYSPQTRELDVLFTTGRRYLFHDVPPEAAEAFRSARIKGRHFNARIRGLYRFSLLSPEPPEPPELPEPPARPGREARREAGGIREA
jgi:lysyl-tRNA synthetase class 2